MEEKKIWLSSPHMGQNEFKYVSDAFRSNWIAPVGPHLDRFEDRLSDISDGKKVAALSSGTSAIHLALILLGIGSGDEVICSSFTFSASANPIVYQGAIPVFVDSELDTWNMSPEYLEEAIKERIKNGKKPKAIIVVHLYGMPANMHDIIQIGSKYGIPIIEDAAEALGSTYFGKPLGTLTDIGVYSFNGNKIITTSSGGALISSDESLIEQAKFLASQARDDYPYYHHSNIGYNYRLSNVSAAIGIGQLEVLDDRVDRRRYIYDTYRRELSNIDDIHFLEEQEGYYSNRWLTTILFSESSKINNDKMILSLAQENIESRHLWRPMHMQPIFSGSHIYGEPHSEYLFQHGLCLPSGSNMTDDDLTRIINNIHKTFEK